MSEKTKADSILEKLTELEKEFQTGLSDLKAAKAAAEPPKHEKEEKEDAIIHIDSCPTCRNKFKEKLRPEIFQEFKEKIKNKELVTCDGCGELVGKDETECPTCHGHSAH